MTALKKCEVLAESFIADPERVARFRREALILAALNHPHVAAIYGLEEGPGGQFLVMELVEGGTLAERMPRRVRGTLHPTRYPAYLRP